MPHPLVIQTAQACVLSATSNILAQVIESYQSNTPFQLRLQPILQFVLYSIVSTPPNCIWQQYIEDQFPGNKPSPEPLKGKDEKSRNGEVKQRLNIANTIRKFILDQTFGAVFNTLMFITFMKGINGASGAEVLEAFKQDSIPLWIAGLKIWPLVAVISFTLIPVERRIVFGSLAGVVWGIYLSLFAASQA